MGIGALDYKKGGSSLDINGIIQDYYVYAGEKVSAGDFVEFVNGVAGTTIETSSDTAIVNNSYAGTMISATALDDNRVFIAHRLGNTPVLYGIVCSVSGTTITSGTDTLLSDTDYTGAYSSTSTLQDGRVFILHSRGSGYYLCGMICSINGTTISVDVTKTITSTTNAGKYISQVAISSKKFFVAHSYGTNRYLYGVVITIGDSSISAGTDTKILQEISAGEPAAAKLMSNGYIFIAHKSNVSGGPLDAIVCSVSGTTITSGTDTVISSANYTGSAISLEALANGNVFIAHSYDTNRYLYGTICQISNYTITPSTSTQLSTTKHSGDVIFSVLLGENKVFIAHNRSDSYYLNGMTVTISGTTMSVSSTKKLNTAAYTGYVISPLLLGENVFIAHSHTDGSFYLYGQVWRVQTNYALTDSFEVSEYETQVRPATAFPCNGVASTSGEGGDETGHKDMVSVYVRDVVPKYWEEVTSKTEYVASDGTRLTASGAFSNTQAYKACDGDASTYWTGGLDLETWLKIEFPVAQKITKMKTYINSDNYDDSFSSATIQGSNNDSTWTNLHTITSPQTELTEIVLNNTTSYKYYRIYAVAINTSSARHINVIEWQMFR